MFASNTVFADLDPDFVGPFLPAPAPELVASPVVTIKTVTLSPLAISMAGLKQALPEYFTAPSLTDAIASVKYKNQKWAIVSKALTRLALIAAHSGTVSPETANTASTAKGVFKNQLLACAAVVEASKAALKGSDSQQAFDDLAVSLEGQFLSIFEPAAKTSEKVTGKSAAERIIAAIQTAVLTESDIKAIRAALSNASRSALV